ncbi:hypothetical protein GON01_10695 [Sphingomonas sp. MAH-20]|uniref:Uncharacterized protein n=1 Tax=Sphingomonas horti TaxID=2682842 RepID=A0A6I4J2U3_9SPHN|nr:MULTISPECIES: hypothetical protein [Sphingomonas]MBA2919518.1 hypothetical protein [Sphingomonas sp. CGMCC 1.13658]MVO78398.1 hypothetical protein [Sphingomonas horti]
MPNLKPDRSSIGVTDRFKGNFTKALYLRSIAPQELEQRLGYEAGRLREGWWLLFALEKPDFSNFEFGGYTYFSGSRIGDPKLGNGRPTVESELEKDLGGPAAVVNAKKAHLVGLRTVGHDRLAKVIPVASGTDYPVGKGIYQCNVPNPIRCEVASFVPPGGMYVGNYKLNSEA